MKNRSLAIVLVASTLAGCSPQGSVEWLEGASYNWDLLNHRVSHLHFKATTAGPTAMIVGGTSTTGLSTDLDPSCESSTCSEFPLEDEAHITMDLVRLHSRKVRSGVGSAELVVGADGASAELTVDFGKRAHGKDEVVALIRGYTLDTNEPLSGGDACYQPRNGWLPRRIAIELGEPVLSADRTSATVTVSGAFEAGVTLETERECLDAVVDQAQVRLVVDVAVLAGADVIGEDLSQSMIYTYGDGPSDPDEQPDPNPAERSTSLGDVDAIGWSKLDFRFHQEDVDGRGAYVRSLSFLGTTDGFGSGHATNYSPGTQYSGFDYTFDGTIVGLGLKGEVERVAVDELVDIELDEDGVPIPEAL
jgi:hypothetical protein